MKAILKILAIPIVSLAEICVMIGSLFGAVVNYVLSFIVGLAAISTVGAWITGDSIAWLFLGVTLFFFFMMVVGEKLVYAGFEWIAKLKMFIKSV